MLVVYLGNLLQTVAVFFVKVSGSLWTAKATCTMGHTVPVPSTEEVAQPRHEWDPRASQMLHSPSRSFACGNTHRQDEPTFCQTMLIVVYCTTSSNLKLEYNSIHITDLCSSSGLLIRLKRMWRSWSLSLGSGWRQAVHKMSGINS